MRFDVKMMSLPKKNKMFQTVLVELSWRPHIEKRIWRKEKWKGGRAWPQTKWNQRIPEGKSDFVCSFKGFVTIIQSLWGRFSLSQPFTVILVWANIAAKFIPHSSVVVQSKTCNKMNFLWMKFGNIFKTFSLVSK